MESEFVSVPVDLKGHVIGRHRRVIDGMMQQSGAIIDLGSREEAGFTVSGSAEEVEMARGLILQKVVSSR